MMGKLAKFRRCGLNDRGRRQLGANARERRVHQLQRGHHVHVPVEEEVHFGRAATGDGADLLQSGHAVYRLFDGTRDGDHHLVDRHHPVVHADDDTRKIGGRKNRDRNGEGEIGSGHHQNEDEKDQRFRVASEPVALVRRAAGAQTLEHGFPIHAHIQSLALPFLESELPEFAGGAGSAIFTFVLSGRP